MQISIVQKVNRQLAYAKSLSEHAQSLEKNHSKTTLSQAVLQGAINALYLGLGCYLQELQFRLKEQGVIVNFPQGERDASTAFLYRLTYMAENHAVPELQELKMLSLDKRSWLAQLLVLYTNLGSVEAAMAPVVSDVNEPFKKIELVNLDAATPASAESVATMAVAAFAEILQRHRETLQYC